MAFIQISIAGIDTQFTLADADAQRILTAYTDILSYSGPTPTPVECVQRIAEKVVVQLATDTLDWEKRQAAQAAQNAVPPLNPVIQP